MLAEIAMQANSLHQRFMALIAQRNAQCISQFDDGQCELDGHNHQRKGCQRGYDG